tara:strand:- start:2998 stop:4881 length:1884 start_codon:yes stop_codon:yes gene_type:complete
MAAKKKGMWVWPDAGSNPITETGIKSTGFSVLTYLNYIVREAVQNTTDAWNAHTYGMDDAQKEKNPAEIYFNFDRVKKPSEKWFSGLEEARRELDINGEEGYGEKINFKKINFLKIVDKNTGGIQGDLKDRESDWWNFVLNWGKSNKRKARRGSTSGSKGIGRISFLLSSECGAVFVFTKRSDKEKIVSGMANLTSIKVNGKLKVPSAIFAEDSYGDVWKLHDKTDEFMGDFKLDQLQGKKDTGSALIIPYPKKELNNDESKNQIIAALIDTYAPLIIRRHLKPFVKDEQLEDSNIERWASKVSEHFREKDKDGVGFIEFLRQSIYIFETTMQDVIEIELDEKCDLENYELSSQDLSLIKFNLDSGKEILFKVNFKLEVNNKIKDSFIEVGFKKTEKDVDGNRAKGIEKYFRNGMALIEQTKKTSDTFHSVVMCREQEMSRFLNVFEDDGHTKLIEGTNEKEQARNLGYGTNYLKVLRLYKNSLRELRRKFEEEDEWIDETSLAPYFQIKKEKIDPDIEDPGEVDKTIKPYKWSQKSNGFTIKHRSKEKLPKKIEIKVSYASARELKKAQYEAWDFDFNNPSMQVINKNCNCSKLNNKISLDNLKKDFELQVLGFDNREPEVTINYE